MNKYPNQYSPSQIEKLLDKWNHFIKHIKNKKKKELTAILLENNETWVKEQTNENK